MPFYPDTDIQICHVDFDDTYTHVIWFSDAAAQKAYFDAVTFATLTRGDYTYARHTGELKLPYNAEQMYDKNYMCFRNANYGEKWFYAFITSVEYVNELTCSVQMEIDVFQTWQFELEINPCYVEREHVDDDTVGKWLLSEPACDLIYADAVASRYVNNPDYIVMQVSARPNRTVDLTTAINVFGGTKPVDSAMVDRQWSAAEFWFFDLSVTDIPKAVSDLFKLFSDVGGADAVLDAFTLSRDYIDSSWLEPLENVYSPTYPGTVIEAGTGTTTLPGTWKLRDGRGLSDMTRTQRVVRPVLFRNSYQGSGYTPVNAKLYTFPYCYAVLSDGVGRETDYRFELSTDPSHIDFKLVLPVASDMTGIAYPVDYDATNPGIPAHIFTWDMTNKVPWYYSAWKNWAAQNGVANTLSVVASVAMMAAGVYPATAGMARAASVMGKAIGASRQALKTPAFGRVGGGGREAMHDAILQQGRFKAAQYATAETEGTLLGIGGMGVASVAEEVATNAAVPDVAKGNVAGNSLAQSGVQGLFLMTRMVREEVARSVDGFFSMYGYHVDRLKVPNVTGRQSWNFVKTANAVMGGRVPVDALDTVNAAFNRGVTFWHTTDIGNYTLPNGVVNNG